MSDSAALRLATGHGPLVGLGNMVGKEYASWWRTRRALIHLIVWLVVVNGFLFLIGADESGGNPYSVLDELIQVFFRVGGLFTTIGIVVATQSAVSGEAELGTAEWVLSKPVTRPAFLLSKLVVNGASFLALAVLVPTVLFFLQTLLHTYLQPDAGRFAAGMSLYVEHLVFYLCLSLALGTLFRARGAIAGTGIGLAFAGLILPNFFPSTLAWTPWGLHNLGYLVASGKTLPVLAWQPILISALWTVLFVLTALWRFDREEF